MRILKILVSTGFFCFLFWLGLDFLRSRSAIENFCKNLQGKNIVMVKGVAHEKELIFSSAAIRDGYYYYNVHSPKNLGRFTCEIKAKDNIVFDMKFIFLD